MEYKFTERYQNWIKGTLALAYLREGLAPAVVKAMQDGYAVYVSRITQKCKISRYSCTSCSIDTLIPAHKPTSCICREKERCNCSTGTNKCPQSGACGEFYDYIVKAHAYNSPFWNYCDFQEISHNFWNFAKCFISGYGKNNIECSDDTDPADMLSICLHYRKLRDQFSSEDVLKKAKEVRNDILHSGKMELTKDDVNAYIDVLIAVLKEKPCQETPHVENGYIIKLERLKRETFVVSEKASVCAHRDGIKAVLEIIEILHTLKDKIECIDSTDDRLAHREDELLLNCRTPEEINERLDTLCAIEKEHKDKLEKHKERCEQIKAILDDIGILKTIKETTRETNAAVKIVHNDVQELKTMLADINKYWVSCTVPIPGIRMEIISANITTTKEKNFQVILIGANTVSDEAWAEVKTSYKKFYDEMARENGENRREVTDTKHECLAVYVQCWTPQAILKLCEDCISGRLTEMFRPVERSLRRIEGYECVTLEVVIYRRDFIKCIDLLVRRLKSHFENLPRTEESISPNRNRLTLTDIAPLLPAIAVATIVSTQENYEQEIIGGYTMSPESNEEDAETTKEDAEITNKKYTFISNDDSQRKDPEYRIGIMTESNNKLDAEIPDGYAMAECGIPSIEKSTDEEGETNCFACLESKLHSEAGLFCNECKHFYCNSCVNGHNAFFQRHKLSWDWDTDKRGMMGFSAEANMSENFEEFQLITVSTLTSKASDDVPEQYCATEENFILEKCDLHPSQDLTVFCNDDQLLCCSICSAEHRKGCNFDYLSRVAKGCRKVAEFFNLPFKCKNMLILLEKTMIELTEEEKLTEHIADVVKRAIQDFSDIICGLINKLKDQTLEAVEKLKTSVSEDLLAQKKRCANFYSQLNSINNAVAKGTVDDTTAFIGLTKGNTILSDARMLIKEIEGRYRCGIEFHADTEIHEILSKMQNVGTVEIFEQTFRVAEKSEVNVTMSGDTTHNCDITAVCEFPNGVIVLADAANSNLKLLNESFQLLIPRKVPGPPLDMCLIEDTKLAVVTTGHVYFFVLGNDGLRSESSIEIHNATGIAYFGCQLYVAKKTALFKYSLDGKNEKQIYKDKAAGSKVTVSRCAISRDGQRIYVTGPESAGLLVLDISGKLLTIVKHDDLVSTRRLQVTPSGHVFVCGSGSQAVMQLDRTRSRLVNVADDKHGLSAPANLLSNSRSCLIIGQEETNRILVFRVI